MNPGAKLQITEIDHETPLFKLSDNANATADPNNNSFSNLSAIDGQIYKTNWQRLIGTELIIDDYGDPVGTVREHLIAREAVKTFTSPSTGRNNGENQELDSRTNFFTTALKACETKENRESSL